MLHPKCVWWLTSVCIVTVTTFTPIVLVKSTLFLHVFQREMLFIVVLKFIAYFWAIITLVCVDFKPRVRNFCYFVCFNWANLLLWGVVIWVYLMRFLFLTIKSPISSLYCSIKLSYLVTIQEVLEVTFLTTTILHCVSHGNLFLQR